MANGWHVHFEPTITHLAPTGAGNFRAVTATPGTKVNPPTGSFQVTTSVRLNLTDDAQGPPPLNPGDPSLPATLEFIGRAKPGPGTSQPFISMGVVKGTATYNTSGSKPVPQFICGKAAAGGASVTIDFTSATTPEIVRSDWVMRIEKHPDTFDTNFVNSFFVQLPWQFIESPGLLQMSARLTINGKLEADENRNTPLNIPLIHNSIPEDADPKKAPFTFFGLRNLYTRANEHQPSPRVPFKVSIGNDVISIIVHTSFSDFCVQRTSATVGQVLSRVADILSDAGFNPVNTLQGARADAECNLHWKRINGHFIGRKITDLNQSQPDANKLEFRLAAAISANNRGSVKIPDGMEERIPFFEFYVFAEDTAPPSPNELAHSEGFVIVPGSVGGVLQTQGVKALITPIIMATAQGSPLRQTLGAIASADHVNLLATTICHEIGHTFGLRHAVAFIDKPPYQTGDANFGRGVMGSSGLVIGSGTPRIPLSFFGPVHLQEIRRLYL